MQPELSTLLDQLFADDRAPLTAALTRRAWLEEHRGTGAYQNQDHHETLECLGDAWLGVVVLTELLHRFPEATPHELTAARKQLVEGAHLAAVAGAHGLQDALRAGAGEVQQGQHRTDSSLADHLEAIVGAAATVGQVEAVTELVAHLFRDAWPTVLDAVDPDDNPVGRLQEWVARQRRPDQPRSVFPKDRMRQQPDKHWVAVAVLPDGTEYEGAPAKNKSEAKRSAARRALEAVGDPT